MNVRTRMSCSQEKSYGTLVVVQRHAFVQTRQHLCVGGFQSQCHFQLAGIRSRNRSTVVATQSGMILDNDRVEPLHPLGDRLIILRRDRLVVEEITAVVELDVARRAAIARSA